MVASFQPYSASVVHHHASVVAFVQEVDVDEVDNENLWLADSSEAVGVVHEPHDWELPPKQERLHGVAIAVRGVNVEG